MKQGLYIDRGPLETRVALIERGRVAEIHIERPREAGRIGAVHLGRVTHLHPDLQAATVALGDDVAGFLRAEDARALGGASPQRLPIGKLVHRGETVLVETARMPGDGKQGRVTADIHLRGRYVVLQPRRTGIEVPKRVGDEATRAALKARVEAAAAGMRVVLRPAAARVEPTLVEAELARLREAWTALERKAAAVNPPALLRPAPSLLERALTELAPAGAETIAVADRALAAELVPLAEVLAPDLAGRITLAPPGQGIELDQTIDEALAPTVEFAGGRLTLEPTRALVAIDVDASAGRDGGVEANLRAIPEIAHQLRLRRLGGPVVVDFVSMRSAQERRRVETALRRAFERDPATVDVGQVDRFSLATLVRSRREPSLAEELTASRAAAPALMPAVAAARVLRRIEADLAEVGAVPVRLTLARGLEAVFDREVRAALAERLARPVTLAFDDRESMDYDVERQR